MKHPTIEELLAVQERCRAILPPGDKYMRVECRFGVGGDDQITSSFSIFHNDNYDAYGDTLEETEAAFCKLFSPEVALTKIQELRKEADALEASLRPEAA